MSPAVRITIIYLIFGGLWIVFSDAAVQIILGQNISTLALIQTLKGWLFIMTTASILYYLLKREFDARQKSENKALEREVSFHQLFTNSPIPMYVYNRQTFAFIDVNDAACARYGYTRDEFARLNLIDLRPAEDAPQVLQTYQESKTQTPPPREARHRTKAGEIFDAEVFFQALTLDGQPAMLIIAQDITERKRAEEKRLENERLRAQLSKDAELHQMRNRFISMVSHEFRRPLTTITTSIELLENYRSKMTEEGSQKHFMRIHEQLNETNELLDDFLALMRTENNQPGANATQVDLTEICRKLVDQIRLSSKSKHTIFYSSAFQRVLVKGDEKLLRHAVSNLLTNAVKYSPNGGEIRLDLRGEKDIEIHVSDQGIGIPAKDQERLFQPFFRASNVEDVKGTGLGLSIARQAIELHGGTLQIAKSDSSGTEFVITLPVNEAVFLTGC